MPTDRPNEVFLSHSSRDVRFVSGLARLLRRHGVSAWYSVQSIVGAQQWHDEIGQALKRCDWFVLVMSPDAVRSKWVKRELLFSLNDNRYEDRIVPVRYKPCDESLLSWVLPAFQTVDLSHGLRAGGADLLRIWGIGYRPAIKDISPRTTAKARLSQLR
jgi:hypothetical protein